MAENETQLVGSYHGEPELTERDMSLLLATVKWIQTAREAAKNYHAYSNFADPEYLPHHVDFLKSRLFWRIRSGKEPLKYPPPTCFSCPWYEVIEINGPHDAGWADKGLKDFESGKTVSICNCSYDVVEKRADGKWLIAYGPYRFLAWNGMIERSSSSKDQPNYQGPTIYIQYVETIEPTE